jgi:glycerophosphoryl diester phosphodiesterase
VLVLGHRGGRGEGWPEENSLAAFARALREGADGIELDVRLSGSGEPVLVHDPTLADGREVARLRRAELPGHVAGLEEALDACAHRLVNVEVKSDVPRRGALVIAVRRALARSRARDVVVSSFDPAVVLGFVGAPYPRAMLVGRRTPRLAVALPFAVRPAIELAHVEDAMLTPEVAARLQRMGLKVSVWTVNDPVHAEAFRSLGVWAVITDRPGEVRRYLGNRRATGEQSG